MDPTLCLPGSVPATSPLRPVLALHPMSAIPDLDSFEFDHVHRNQSFAYTRMSFSFFIASVNVSAFSSMTCPRSHDQ